MLDKRLVPLLQLFQCFHFSFSWESPWIHLWSSGFIWLEIMHDSISEVQTAIRQSCIQYQWWGW
jgi:hypothetical protein